MINSLRLHGHAEPDHVLDCGLPPGNARCSPRGHVELAAIATGRRPGCSKTIAPRAPPGDGDDPDRCRHDRDATADGADRARGRRPRRRLPKTTRIASSPSWGELLDLGQARRRPYVSSGLITLGGAAGETVLGCSTTASAGSSTSRLLRAPRHARLRLPLPRAGHSQRDSRHARRRGAHRHARQPARPRPAVPGPADRPARAACAAFTTTAPSPSSCISSCASRGSSRCITASTRACCLGCCWPTTSRSWSARMLSRGGCAGAWRPARATAVDLLRPRPLVSRVTCPAGSSPGGARPRAGGPGAMTEVAFYCVAGERYFLGAVALVNSLRLVGHREPVFLLDCGLSDGPARADRHRGDHRRDVEPSPPRLLKTIAPLATRPRRWS